MLALTCFALLNHVSQSTFRSTVQVVLNSPPKDRSGSHAFWEESKAIPHAATERDPGAVLSYCEHSSMATPRAVVFVGSTVILKASKVFA